MKILVICYEFPPLGGGAASVCHFVSREFVTQGHHVDIVTMGFKGLPKFEVIDGINIYRVPCLRARKDICRTYEMVSYAIKALPLTVRLVRKNRYDINHTHFIFPSAFTSYFVKKFTKLPYVVTSHGSDVQGYNPDRFKLEHKLFKPLWRLLAQGAERITSPSESLKQLILSHGVTRPIDVIPNAVAVDQIHPNSKKRIVLMVSRLLPRKGFQYVLEALAGIDTDFKAIVVGEGPYADTLKALARDKGLDVRFPGWMEKDSPELMELFESASIFALPSEMENFSIALAEAMAAGSAIITSNTGGCPEVVGDAALLVEPRNTSDIKEKLQRLIEDEGLREELGTRARKRVEEHFTWPVVSRRYEACFKEVIRT
ncbi:MAG: glycosyltransferase family 4 protein [Planctomycetota bacterium]